MKRVVIVVLGVLVLAAAALAAVVAAPDSSVQSTGEQPPALEDFEPSEELPADSAISFPVDI
jgi:hypothetical protein